jgi:hypothetical protein
MFGLDDQLPPTKFNQDLLQFVLRKHLPSVNHGCAEERAQSKNTSWHSSAEKAKDAGSKADDWITAVRKRGHHGEGDHSEKVRREGANC